MVFPDTSGQRSICSRKGTNFCFGTDLRCVTSFFLEAHGPLEVQLKKEWLSIQSQVFGSAKEGFNLVRADSNSMITRASCVHRAHRDSDR